MDTAAEAGAKRLAPVTLASASSPPLDRVPASVDEALRDVTEWSADLLPGHGSTTALWELLATLAAADLGVARAVEPHLDAIAILDQARPSQVDVGPHPTATWGVFAAQTPTASLDASGQPGERWRLDGLKPWCSLADRLDAALVTARMPGGTHEGLFAVDLRAVGVTRPSQAWVSRGLHEIPSTPLRFDDVPGQLVRDGDWYVQRPGFWWGAIGVAACWYGGAVGIARRVFAEAVRRSEDRLVAMHLGAIDERLFAARELLAHAATAVDVSGAATDGGRGAEEPAARSSGRILAKRVRAVVARTCEDVLLAAGHALGPGPLTGEDQYAKRVADLQVYIRQHHAERDEASLGSALVAEQRVPW